MLVRLQAKLAPEAVGAALIRAGALLTGYELVKSSVIDGVRSFYTMGFDEAGLKLADDYRLNVTALDPKSALRASVAWLVVSGALTPAQADTLDRVRAHRGEVTHELARLLVDVDAEVDLTLLHELQGLMHALDLFWGGIEIDINQDLDGRDIDPSEVHSGSRLLLDYLCDLCGLDDGGPATAP